MCGLVGSLHWEKPDHPNLIQRMARTLKHRGPDAEKICALGPLVLGHRRLSIIDVSPQSNQPMSDHSGRYWIVYNGELYNFKTLKKELIGLGHHFKTDSDTEVILEAWKRFGVAALEKLVGMFAFAIWDQFSQTLFMARDRLGEKPLYYFSYESSDSFNHNLIFASELQALCLHPKISHELNPKAFSEFLSLNYILTDTCMLKGIEKLPPAHYLLLKKGQKPTISCYWNLSRNFQEKQNWRSKEEATEQLQTLIQQSVSGQMISDVPLGAFLSGGIDSSTIVAAMTREKPAHPPQTFSIGFKEASYNELTESIQVAKHLKVDHHTQFVETECIERLPHIMSQTDEPFADNSLIPTYFLAEFARQSVKVCLSGDGGDELFAGYETYTADKLYHFINRLPKSLLQALSFSIDRFWPVSHQKISFDYKLKQFLKGCLHEFHRAHYFWRIIFDETEKKQILNPSVQEAILLHDPFQQFAKHYQAVENCHPLDQASYVDIKTWMVDDILVKVDRLSMAHSLEVRAPFLNHHLVEFAASLPVHWKMKGFQKKHLLKCSQEPFLPNSILHRAKKGFNAPIAPWFSGKLKSMGMDITLGNKALAPWINTRVVEKLWAEQFNHIKDHSHKLFGLMCLGLWLDNFQRRKNEVHHDIDSYTCV